jgi:hypothetical protein
MSQKGRCAVAMLLVLACGSASSAQERPALARAERCQLPPTTEVHQEGNAVLATWEMPDSALWLSETLPENARFVAFRAAIVEAGGDNPRPQADPPRITTDADRELWRREDANAALVHADGGEVRRIRCLEAALFARQHDRYSQLTQPTEFIAHVLRRGNRLRVYFGAGNAMFPPRSVYGTDRVGTDVAAGWEYWATLHNHTVRSLNGRPALGVPAPSTSDVQFFRSLVSSLGLREVWVTNGMYTGIVSAELLPKFHTRD